MKGPRTPASRRALGVYAAGSRGDRLHTLVRWWSVPFPELEREVPRSGRILEVGCGHGLLSCYLALSSTDREVVGIDIDPAKIEHADQARARLRAGEADLRFELVEPGRFPDGTFDAIVIADVLYLLGRQARSQVLDDCVAHLAPRGVLVVKEIDTHPRWKAILATVQERLSTGILGITEGDEVSFADPAEFVERLESAGLQVTTRRIDRGYLHPHHLIRAVPSSVDPSRGQQDEQGPRASHMSDE